MYCPRCRVEILDEQCPRCGLKIQSLSEKAAEASRPRQEPINFNFTTRKTSEERPTISDWRAELRRKLNERSEKREEAALPRVVPGLSAEQAQPAEAQIERPLFQYKLSETEQAPESQRIVTFAKKPDQPSSPLEKPLIRRPATSRPPRRARAPEQQELQLEVPAFEPEGSAISRAAEMVFEPPRVSREILFSRFLAGIIDLLVPVLIGLLFTFVASWVLNFDFFGATSLRLAVVFSLSFYFFNSFFFLLTARQTPGMFLTDLELSDEESEEIPFGSICLRICLFLPVAATLVGLLWGFFDPGCRCLHDRLSQTRVISKPATGEAARSAAHPNLR